MCVNKLQWSGHHLLRSRLHSHSLSIQLKPPPCNHLAMTCKYCTLSWSKKWPILGMFWEMSGFITLMYEDSVKRFFPAIDCNPLAINTKFLFVSLDGCKPTQYQQLIATLHNDSTSSRGWKVVWLTIENTVLIGRDNGQTKESQKDKGNKWVFAGSSSVQQMCNASQRTADINPDTKKYLLPWKEIYGVEYWVTKCLCPMM